MYSVRENGGPVQPVLVLSNPVSFDVTLQVTDSENSAMGKQTTKRWNNIFEVASFQKYLVLYSYFWIYTFIDIPSNL